MLGKWACSKDEWNIILSPMMASAKLALVHYWLCPGKSLFGDCADPARRRRTETAQGGDG